MRDGDGAIVRMGAMGCFLVVLVGAGLSFAAGSRRSAAVTLGVAGVLVVGVVAFAVVRGSRAVSVTLDEGGIRADRASHGDYVPFARIRSCRMRSWLGNTDIVLEMETGRRTIPLMDRAAFDLGPTLERAIAQARGAAIPTSAATLARSGQPLDVWLRRAREGTAGDGYRARAVDPDELAAIALDRAGDIELRAAAAHALLSSRTEESRAGQARLMEILGPSTPPIVIIAAALATSRSTYIDGFSEALRYVTPAEREMAERLASERS